MEIFFTLMVNLAPLYLLIGLGYIAGRWLDVNLQSIARINIFILMPVVIFGAIIQMDFSPAYLLLPVALYLISTIVTLSSFNISKLIWSDGNANLIGAGNVNGNAVYFGLPLILTFFGPAMAGIYLFMNLGPQINHITLAYFLTARGRHSGLQSFKKVLAFPAVHAAWLGVAVNLTGWKLPSIGLQYWEYAAGALVLLGMMMIGISLGKLKVLQLDIKLLSAFLLTKFGAWPLLCFGFISLDQYILGLFETNIHQMIMVFSVMPLIGNLVAYAAEYDLYPERAAVAVLCSTLFTLIAIPFVFWFFGITI